MGGEGGEKVTRARCGWVEGEGGSERMRGGWREREEVGREGVERGRDGGSEGGRLGRRERFNIYTGQLL